MSPTVVRKLATSAASISKLNEKDFPVSAVAMMKRQPSGTWAAARRARVLHAVGEMLGGFDEHRRLDASARREAVRARHHGPRRGLQAQQRVRHLLRCCHSGLRPREQLGRGARVGISINQNPPSGSPASTAKEGMAGRGSGESSVGEGAAVTRGPAYGIATTVHGPCFVEGSLPLRGCSPLPCVHSMHCLMCVAILLRRCLGFCVSYALFAAAFTSSYESFLFRYDMNK